MALFGDEDGDVGPFVMAEGAEEWFPFTLDNLEMDRACSSLPEDSRPMDQDGDGETDQDDDVDGGNPSKGASGPGPPPNPRNRAGGGDEDQHQQQQPPPLLGAGEKTEAQTQGLMEVVPEPKARLDKVKPEAKEVHAHHDRKRQTTEAAAQAKRCARDKNGGVGSSKSKQKRRPAGGMAGGVGGMTGRVEGQAGGGGEKASSKGSKSGSGSAASGGGGGSGGSSTKPPAVQNKRRLERNAREQKRSLKISQRIEDLRRMLSQFGVDVKTSKSAVLSEATDYIAHLQRQQAQYEAERARLLQLLHNATAGSAAAAIAAAATGRAGGVRTAAHGGAVKPPPSGVPLPLEVGRPAPGAAAGAAGVAAVQQEQQQPPPPQQMNEGFGGESSIALQSMLTGSLLSLNGDSDIGKPATAGAGAGAVETSQQQAERLEVVPGFPELSTAVRSIADGIMSVQPAETASRTSPGALDGAAAAAAAALSHVNYERVFRTAPMPMAIANVNGNLVDCNTRLSQATGFRRDEVLFMTIFDLVADPFLQHTFSMISSILSMRGVTNAPFFQVPGKHCSGGAGGVVQISAVHDEQLRPMHFSICILDSPTSGGTSAAAVAAAAAATASSGAGSVGAGNCGGGVAGSVLGAGGGINAGSGGGGGGTNNRVLFSGPGVPDGGGGGGGGGVVGIRGNLG
eukprot:g13361.t1